MSDTQKHWLDGMSITDFKKMSIKMGFRTPIQMWHYLELLMEIESLSFPDALRIALKREALVQAGQAFIVDLEALNTLIAQKETSR